LRWIIYESELESVRSRALADDGIPTRYSIGLPDLTPGQVYTRKDAQQGLEAARAIVLACREWLVQQ